VKILYVGPYPPARDGIGVYTRVLADAMRGLGHEVAVLADRPTPGAPGEVIGHLGHPRAARAAVTRYGPDVIHLQFAVPAFGARTPGLLRLLHWLQDAPVPAVATLHEINRDIALLRAPGRALYRRLATHCDRLIVHTETALNTLTAATANRPANTLATPANADPPLPGAGPGRHVVIPHFAAPPPPAATSAAEVRRRFGLGDERLLLAFGYVHVHKGLDDLGRALALLPPSALRDVRIVIAGAVRRRHGPFRLFEARDVAHLAAVRRLARRHRLLDRLVCTGYVPEDDIAAWFEAAEAVVLPYRKAEQSGVANLAAAFGVPVIGTTAGGLADLLAGSPWTVPPRTPHLLAEAIAGFLRAGPEERAVPLAPGADLATVAARTIAVYQAALSGAAGSGAAGSSAAGGGSGEERFG
jgi:glycosyltransferase involved in cell wall biosynthesis